MASKDGITYRGEKDVSAEHVEYIDAKKPIVAVEEESVDHDDDKRYNKPPKTARELVTEILLVEDDPTVNPWTFRMWFIGIGMSVFAGTVTTINTFKPQSIHIHLVFVAVITYIMGMGLAAILPSKGRLGRILNPGPFNKKEHAAICIMCAASAATPEAMTVLAVQKLYYNIQPNPAVGVFLILSTQMLGYGVAGMLRRTLVYPSNMLYPTNLPTASLLESLHRDRKKSGKRMKVFYIAFAVLFCWQAFPQYIAPIMAGVSVFCLSMRHNLFVTNMFGGSMANEGLGTLSLSFDWTMISAHGNPLWVPFQTIMNSLLGYLLAIGCFMGLYYSNIWNARKYPFLSPNLFSDKSTAKKYVTYNQTAILNSQWTVDKARLEKVGLPWLSSSHALGMTTQNIAIMATVTHMIVWHWDDIKTAFEVVHISKLKKLLRPKEWDLKFWKHKETKISDEEAERIDPHYRLMQAYRDVPSWWFAGLWVASATVGLITSRLAGSTLDWWAFFVAIFISTVSLVFFAPLQAMFGFNLNVQPLIQMIGAFMLPGRPLANMYFATFGYNSLYQAKNLLKDLKLGQYAHLAPRCTFSVQVVGTSIGCLMSYTMMQQITTDKREILLAIQGTNVWSGQTIQRENSAAVTWGGLAKYLYGVGGRYQFVSLGFLIGLAVPLPTWFLHKKFPKLRLDYLNTAIVCGTMNILSHGTHSALLLHYVTGFISQYWLRKYRTNWFIKYNYILSAGMDGGAQVIAFLLTFTVFGAGGKPVPFPPYWGNNHQKGNYDYCMRDPGLGKKKAH
ncbi:OPT superfamily oligopeptide transporter [Trichodelitschia bisporula]|uniref:OPT superfamily oligopeptide transporter n=1 Tax=Trichodelitschia bisporula TaxID=703511 RepID=A0A6G1HT69_9PEZI|nr:OPT superfamily oligopeptide transporter [Trichodelitschia bisporula]